MPLLVAYAITGSLRSCVPCDHGDASVFFGGYRELPRCTRHLVETVRFVLLVLGIFAVFFLVIRHNVQKTLKAVSTGGTPQYSPAGSLGETGSGRSSWARPGPR